MKRTPHSHNMKRAAEQDPGTRHPQRSKKQADPADEASTSSVPVQPVDLGIDDVTLCVDSDTKTTANRDDVDSGCPLADLCHIEDLWERVCSHMSGDALSRAARVPVFCLPTRRTPAFIFLAGVNNDAEPVPWYADNNVLSVNFNPWCSRCNRYSCHHHGKDWDRHVQATKASERMLHEVALPAYLIEQRTSNPSRYVCSGPARPPSPWKCADSSYEPLEQLGWDHMQHLYPPVFGIRAGFTYAPFWNVLVGHHLTDDEIDSSDYSASDYL